MIRAAGGCRAAVHATPLHPGCQRDPEALALPQVAAPLGQASPWSRHIGGVKAGTEMAPEESKILKDHFFSSAGFQV